MPTKRQHNLIIIFIFLLVVGLLFGNTILIAMAVVPFLVVLFGTMVSAPSEIFVETGEIPPKLQLSREFNLIRRVTVLHGYGLVKLYQELPQEFELISGNNLRLLWKRRKPVRIEIVCRLRCSKRGNYVIPQLEWFSRHPLYLSANSGKEGNTPAISVWPHLLKHRQVRQLKDLALSPFPLADVSKTGVAGTDFREIRSYVTGDPVKTINWKATAHRANPASIWPLVNEYEREGRRSVLVFLDTSESVEIGSTIENVLEYSIEAASNLLYYFIDRGYRVGMSVSGDPGREFYPDSGRQVLTRVIPQLVRLKAGGEPIRLLNSIDNFRNYILNHKPLSVVVTTLDTRSVDVLEKFFEKLRSYYSQRRRPPIVLVNVIGRDLIPQPEEYESNLSALMYLQSRSGLYKLRKTGVTILEWNPHRQSFHSVLAARMKR
ncbi:MAG TPA: DUF58 domain-containing protein [Dehalococcoidia bacterium]|nr:DUF58 domain-containing protein [Dehalococcoidia bacterium]